MTLMKPMLRLKMTLVGFASPRWRVCAERIKDDLLTMWKNILGCKDLKDRSWWRRARPARNILLSVKIFRFLGIGSCMG